MELIGSDYRNNILTVSSVAGPVTLASVTTAAQPAGAILRLDFWFTGAQGAWDFSYWLNGTKQFDFPAAIAAPYLTSIPLIVTGTGAAALYEIRGACNPQTPSFPLTTQSFGPRCLVATK